MSTDTPMNTLLTGDALDMLRIMPDGFVQTCVTSPPYYGLRDYGVSGQIGLEETPWAYIGRLVQVFREVRRVLRDDGTLWLNIGDSYVANKTGGIGSTHSERMSMGTLIAGANRPDKKPCGGMKPKDLMMIPARLAIALCDDGWYLRSDIIWHKPNAMPESVQDRPTNAHEHVFLLAKSERYYYDAQAITEPASYIETRNGRVGAYQNRAIFAIGDGTTPTAHASRDVSMRNKRNVWTIATHSYPGAHFATMPPKLIETCILAGSFPRNLVLDPFMGAGTVALVALQQNRHYLGIELNPAYVELARKRIETVQPTLWEVSA